MPQVQSERPVNAALSAVATSAGNAYLKSLKMARDRPSDALPRASPSANELANAKLVLAGPPQVSADDPLGPPLPPDAAGLPGARQPVVSPGPLPRKLLVWNAFENSSP